MPYKSPLDEMSKTTPTQFWNDNCSIEDIKLAMEHGCVGATTNPVIVGQVLEGDLTKYKPVIKRLARENPNAAEDEVAWLLNEKMAVDAAEILHPVYVKTQKKTGYISIQTNTKYWRNHEEITKQAVRFSKLADNVMVKMPVTFAGVKAIEESTYQGVNVNATVSFSVSQAVAAAEAMERGMKRRSAEGLDNSFLYPVCTIMEGRVEDWLNEVKDVRNIIVDPNAIVMSGVYVIKNAYKVFMEKGYRARLLAAAYRHHHHWSELIGGEISHTIPPLWIRRYINSDITVEDRLHRPPDQKLLAQLQKHFDDFNKAYEPNGMKPEEFDGYGATKRTLMQFLNAYDKMVAIVRGVMIND